ncbi:signal peptidase I [Ruania suaedae]|uniref:signal peptidase I n=1 Tax=Ruania suaedae TaxID=2897774 RepID=UPI001E436CCF|nr:signal peptidase I [Ruania suaedae]UFU04151.1 signal peptidase I [Ruania suaedae]
MASEHGSEDSRERDEGDEQAEASTPDSGEDSPSSQRERSRRRRHHPVVAFLRETVVVLVAALVLSVVIKTFLAQAFYIPSESMEHTLEIGDRLVVNKLTPGPFDLERGDVVVFLDPGGWLASAPPEDPHALEQVLTWVGVLPQHADEHVIKRVVGLPGDHVVCCSEEGQIVVNGQPIDEPYVADGAAPSDVEFDVVVPAGHLYVLGDNRPRSKDSRFNGGSVGGGFVPVRNVVGTAFVITWPLDRITWLTDPDETFADVPDPS